MRTIKFRVWCEGSKGMSYDITNLSFYMNNKFPIMQFTGLKDKNGKEIYECDIIRYIYPDNSGHKDYKVEWGENEVCTGTTSLGDGDEDNVYSTYLGWHFVDIEYNDYADYNYIPIKTDCEVIGNIYENPELLEEKK